METENIDSVVTSDVKIDAKPGTCSDVESNVAPPVEVDNGTNDITLSGKWSKSGDQFQKRKRPRRKSRKGKSHPYNKSTWEQKRRGNTSERANRVREEMFANGQPVAPYNTNQFLMDDHEDPQIMAARLQEADSKVQYGPWLPRARDSSFSVDSEDDYFYYSPEDEEEFLTKEFSNAYENLHVERLSSMSKSEIIKDFIELETKYEKCLAELRRMKRGGPSSAGVRLDDADADTDTSSKSESELSEKLRLALIENKTRTLEVEDMRLEIKRLHGLLEKRKRSSSSSSSSSSVDSDSDSSSSSSMSCSSSTNEEIATNPPPVCNGLSPPPPVNVSVNGGMSIPDEHSPRSRSPSSPCATTATSPYIVEPVPHSPNSVSSIPLNSNTINTSQLNSDAVESVASSTNGTDSNINESQVNVQGEDGESAGNDEA